LRILSRGPGYARTYHHTHARTRAFRGRARAHARAAEWSAARPLDRGMMRHLPMITCVSLCLYAFTAPVIHIAIVSINLAPSFSQLDPNFMAKTLAETKPREERTGGPPAPSFPPSFSLRPPFERVMARKRDAGEQITRRYRNSSLRSRDGSISPKRTRHPIYARNVWKRSVTLGALSRHPRRREIDRAPLTPSEAVT